MIRDSLTYVDVFSQELVRDAVLVDNVVVHAGAGGGCSEEEAKKSAAILAMISNNNLEARAVRLFFQDSMMQASKSYSKASLLLSQILEYPSMPVTSFIRPRNLENTHPPLKAPTGFFTGATTASCLSAALV